MIVSVISGFYRGMWGKLRRRFVVHGIEWVEIETYDSLLIVRTAQTNLCSDERRAVDEALLDEQFKRGLR